MNRFRQGILIGLILSVVITLAIAFTLNDERRRQLRYRLEKLRDALPNVEQLKQSAQDVTSKARETGSSLGGQLKQSAQDVTSKARETGSNLGGQVQESAGKLVQHTQEILTAAQQKAASLGDK